MSKKKVKKSIITSIRNNFIAGIVVLIPIGITLYLTLFFIKVSSKILPKEINPNHYLPFDIPGLEILISVILITFVGWLSLSFIGKRLINLFDNLLNKIPILRTIYSSVGQLTETFTSKSGSKKMLFWLNIQEKVLGLLVLQQKRILEKLKRKPNKN